MDPVDLLEKRIRALELQVCPESGEMLRKPQAVTDLLLQTQSMTATALSCREIVTTILKRVEEINDYLNPSYCDNQLDIKDKCQYVLELYPEMSKLAHMVSDYQQLQKVLEESPLDNISQLVHKLNQLTIMNANAWEECRIVSETIMLTLQKYNDIAMTLKILFTQMEHTLNELELNLQKKLSE